MEAKKILVVDDNSIILKTLTLKLKGAGYQVLTATDGSSAVSLARREKLDLLLLDLNFPPDVGHGGGVPWDGFLILSWLKHMQEAQGIPIIVITGSDSAKDKQNALAVGVVGYFQKPIDHEQLLARIGQVLGQAAPAAAVPA